MLKEFKEFALKGNMIDMAVGIVVGAAFGTVIKSLVADIVTPPIGLLTEKVDFKNLGYTLRDGVEGGAEEVRINFGSFLNELISFLIVAAAIFLVIKLMNRVRAQFEAEKEDSPTSKKCDACKMEIPVEATRCGHCTSDVSAS
ncbi:MAG: large conductance mechanosensitive channel protein MscL [Rubripirellula sp.]